MHPKDESTPIIPFKVTSEDYFLSLPIDEITPLLIRLAAQQYLPWVLYPKAVKAIMERANKRKGTTCKICQHRKVSRIFLIFRATQGKRMTGFALCEICTDRMKRGVQE